MRLLLPIVLAGCGFRNYDLGAAESMRRATHHESSASVVVLRSNPFPTAVHMRAKVNESDWRTLPGGKRTYSVFRVDPGPVTVTGNSRTEAALDLSRKGTTQLTFVAEEGMEYFVVLKPKWGSVQVTPGVPERDRIRVAEKLTKVPAGRRAQR